MRDVELSVDFPAVANAENKNHQSIVFDLADEPVITHAVFPELAELGALQSLTNAAWVIQWGDAFVEKLQDALALLRVELAQFAVDLGGEFNLPGHAASEHLPVEWSALPRYGCDPGCARPCTGPRDRRDVRGWLRGRRRSWCGPCGGRVFPGVFRWIGGGGWPA